MADNAPKLEYHFTIIDAGDIQYEKRPIEDILEDAKTLDAKKIAEEVLVWLEANVENFIDNRLKIFNLNLILDADDQMTEARKLQDLYRAIPEDEHNIDMSEAENVESLEDGLSEEDKQKIDEIVKCRATLNEVTQQAYEDMQESKEYLEALFNKMVYYYEMKGISQGQPLIQEQKGSVAVIKFEYEAFSVGVEVLQGQEVDPEGNIIEAADPINRDEKQVLKKYVIPEGFSCWVEISYQPKERPTSLF